jgi:hypothetical protein
MRDKLQESIPDALEVSSLKDLRQGLTLLARLPMQKPAQNNGERLPGILEIYPVHLSTKPPKKSENSNRIISFF